jgi:hypothetical protein
LIIFLERLRNGLFTDAESSPTLCHLAGPFDKASAALSSSTNQIKSGKASSQDIDNLNNDINAVQRGAAADGVPAPDQVPSDAQLTSGGRWPAALPHRAASHAGQRDNHPMATATQLAIVVAFTILVMLIITWTRQ